jgi:hypothetical protein
MHFRRLPSGVALIPGSRTSPEDSPADLARLGGCRGTNPSATDAAGSCSCEWCLRRAGRRESAPAVTGMARWCAAIATRPTSRRQRKSETAQRFGCKCEPAEQHRSAHRRRSGARPGFGHASEEMNSNVFLYRSDQASSPCPRPSRNHWQSVARRHCWHRPRRPSAAADSIRR